MDAMVLDIIYPMKRYNRKLNFHPLEVSEN